MSRTNPPSETGAVIDLSSRLRRRESDDQAVKESGAEARSTEQVPGETGEVKTPESVTPLASVARLGAPSKAKGPEDFADHEDLDAEDEVPSKHDYLAELLSQGKVQIRLDPRRPGVVVPEQFAHDPVLALNLSWRFPNTDMVLNERGVAATLRFGGIPFRCRLPWHSIWGIAIPGSDWLQVWTYDLPVELGGPPRPEDEEAVFVEPGRPRLSVLKPVMDAGSEESPEADSETVGALGATAQSGPKSAEPEGAVEQESGEGEESESSSGEDGSEDPPKPRRPTLRLVR